MLMKYFIVNADGDICWSFEGNKLKNGEKFSIRIVKGLKEGYKAVDKGKQFLRLYVSGDELMSGLTLEERGLLSVMTYRIRYNSNEIPVNARELSEETGIGYRKMLKLMHALEEKNLIRKWNGAWYMNPDIVNMGNAIPEKVADLFTLR